MMPLAVQLAPAYLDIPDDIIHVCVHVRICALAVISTNSLV